MMINLCAADEDCIDDDPSEVKTRKEFFNYCIKDTKNVWVFKYKSKKNTRGKL